MNRLRSTHLPAPQLREALRSDLDALPDAELLDRFARYADHPAFEVLLRRHGPMVLGVCRRMLAATDADDAFQATFLVLIRKARELRGERLGPWLYGVAYRVGLKARTRAARIASFRSEVTDMIPDPNAPAGAPDWLPILDAELAAVPSKYRDPLVLCELQGATRIEAAKALGVPEGTLSSRLARGREMLRRRLLKHGTLLPASGLAALFSENAIGRTTVTAALLARASELAKVATGAATGTVPVAAARLTDEVLKSMFLTKLRVAGAALAALALTAVGMVAVALPADAVTAPNHAPGTARGLTPDPKVAVAPPQPAAQAPVGAAPVEDAKALQGLWSVVRYDTTKPIQEEAQFYYCETSLQLFITGDVWWEICTLRGNGCIRPCVATLFPNKTPKWLDVRALNERSEWPIKMFDKRLYLFDPVARADQLTIISNFARHRPAEFNPQDEDAKLLSLVYQRRKLGPPAGAPALLGSWEQRVRESKKPDKEDRPVGNDERLSGARVEVYDNLIFIGNVPDALDDESDWLGGTYTLDTSRNPPGIDISLFNPLPDNITKVYGSYETTRDGVRLVLGLTGKRAERPMDFAPASDDDAPERLYLDLKRAALRLSEKPVAPRPEGEMMRIRRGF